MPKTLENTVHAQQAVSKGCTNRFLNTVGIVRWITWEHFDLFDEGKKEKSTHTQGKIRSWFTDALSWSVAGGREVVDGVMCSTK